MAKTSTRGGPGKSRPVIYYAPKCCIACGEEFVPTSGRQVACTHPACKRVATNLRRKQRRAAAAGRPSEKPCEWPSCEVWFPVSWTGVLPKFCPEHYRRSIASRQQRATEEWRNRTLDIPCRYPECVRLQHPSAQGWCHYHYPILSVHDLGADEWWAFFDKQEGLCPICCESLLDGRKIVVDHDHEAAPSNRHKKEHARGLLHAAPCNSVIVGGIETAMRNGWLENAFRYISTQES